MVYKVESRGHNPIVSASRAGDAEVAEQRLREHIAAFTDIFVRDIAAGQTVYRDLGTPSLSRSHAVSDTPHSRRTYLRTLPFSVSGSSAT